MWRFSKKEEGLWRTICVVLLGQLISFIMSLSAFSNSYLASLGVDAPITQSFFTYMSLTAVYGSISLFRRKKLMVSWYYYVPLSFVDVLGNFLVIKAYQYTSITSATLLDCWTIPWVMVLTYFFIGSRYSISQYFGVATCVLGLALALLSDAGLGGGGGSRPLLGDFLVIGGTLFYALSNVGEVQTGALRVTHISGDDQLADALTKPLPRPRFETLVSKIGLVNGQSILRGNVKDKDHPKSISPPNKETQPKPITN